MKKILIVEDQPALKIELFITLLEKQNIPFEYELVGSITSAKRYLARNANCVDLIITDLGLPIFDGEYVNNLLEGVNLINDLEDFDVEVPVVINSTTQIPDFKFKKAEWETRGLKIYKTEYILDMKNWFVEFLKAE